MTIVKRFVCISIGLLVSTSIYAQNGKKTVIDRYRTFLFNSKVEQTWDTRTTISTLDKNGTWNDINYSDGNPAAWQPEQHLERVRELCLAYVKPGSEFFEQRELKQAIDISLDHWLRIRYQNKNWWHNEIGVPQYMRDILYLMYGRLTTNQLKDALEVLNQAKVKGEGANLTWSADLVMHHSLLTDDWKTVRDCRDLLIREVKVTKLDGIQPDFSYHQHGPRLQMYHYGNSFLKTNVRLAWELHDTEFAFPKAKIAILNNFITEGWQWMCRGLNTVPATLDRAVSRKNTLHDPDIRDLIGMLKELSPEHAAVFNQIKNSQDSGKSAVTGYRYFPASDFSVYHTDEFSFFLKSISDRTLITESINKENIKGRLLNSGDTYLIKDGNEYFNLMPCWDWNKLPGITNFNGNAMVERKPFTGNVSDGKSGLAAMDYALVDQHKNVSAHKVWISHKGLVVCLIAGLTAHNITDSLFTVLDQSRWRGNVTFNQPGNLLKEGTNTLNAVKWLHHSGFAYIPLSPLSMTVKLEKVDGTWKSINNAGSTEKITESIFLPQINHEQKSGIQSLGYVLASSPTPESAARIANQPSWRIVSNTSSIQVLSFTDGAIFGAFFNKGSVKIDQQLLSVSMPCLIGILPGGIYISDPTHKGGAINVVLNNKKYQITLPSDGGSVRLRK